MRIGSPLLCGRSPVACRSQAISSANDCQINHQEQSLNQNWKHSVGWRKRSRQCRLRNFGILFRSQIVNSATDIGSAKREIAYRAWKLMHRDYVVYGSFTEINGAGPGRQWINRRNWSTLLINMYVIAKGKFLFVPNMLTNGFTDYTWLYQNLISSDFLSPPARFDSANSSLFTCNTTTHSIPTYEYVEYFFPHLILQSDLFEESQTGWV